MIGSWGDPPSVSSSRVLIFNKQERAIALTSAAAAAQPEGAAKAHNPCPAADPWGSDPGPGSDDGQGVEGPAIASVAVHSAFSTSPRK